MKRSADIGHARVVHRHAWLWEPLEPDAGFVLRPMFGAQAAYLDGNLMLCFCAGEEPWRGLLICTDRAHHAALISEFPELRPHSVLPKWLYLPESVDTFERSGTLLVSLARHRDPRIGVEPKPKKKRAPAKSAKAAKPAKPKPATSRRTSRPR
ncbi:MAG: hypothetical protein JNK23_24130 [Opitutaceae bacterium]|nr:hypothetical protein [Opitutaceae bacterium]